MNPEIKKRWIEALRSGDYKQGRGQLKDSKDRFCVLGVLCDLHSKDVRIQWYRNTFEGRKLNIPRVTRQWAGIKSLYVDIKGVKVHLTELNDGGMDFKMLANLIESNL